LSIVNKIISKIPEFDPQIFIRKQNFLIDKMKDVGMKIQEIDRKSGQEILSYLGTVSVNAIGVPISIPQRFGFIVAGFPIGFFLQFRLINKLRPYYTELKALKAEFDQNVEKLRLYDSLMIYQGLNDIEVKKNILTEEDILETEKFKTEKQKQLEPNILDNIGLGEIQRSANITNNGIYFILALIISGFIYYQSKRKNTKK
jgi:hypothetical protein